MAMDWKTPTIDAVIVVGGAGILNEFVVKNVQFIGDLLNKLPADMMGISIKTLVLGAVALIVAKNYITK